MSEQLEPADPVETARAMASVSGDPSRQLTEQQMAFAGHYVANGGNGLRAAEAAGYAHPNVLASRQLCNPRVLALIKRLCMAHADAALPVAIRTLIACCDDEKASWKDRRQAALDLAKMSGVGRSDGPSVAVQVNVGDAQPASAVLRNVWAERDARMSGIAAPMPDTNGQVIEHRATGEPRAAPAPGRGGDEF